MRSDFIEAGGLRFHCLIGGDASKPLLLMLHGFPEYSGGYEELIERLSADYYCVAPDQRGYNTSDKPEGVGEYVAGKLAEDAAAILQHFAPKARAVIGHDWGASVAYALVFKRPDLMKKFVILNGAHPVPFQRAQLSNPDQAAASAYIHYLRSEKAEARLSANNYAKLAALFAEGMDMSWLHGERLEKYRAAWSQPGALTGMLNWYRASPLSVPKEGEAAEGSLAQIDPEKVRVRVPHLLIWGLNDMALRRDAFEGLEEFCDDLTIRTFDDADHWILHQKPDECAALIREFVG